MKKRTPAPARRTAPRFGAVSSLSSPRNLGDATGDANGGIGEDTPSRADAGEVSVEVERLLHNPARHEVRFAFSLHNATKTDEGFRFHCVLKFRYDVKLIGTCFGDERPEKNIEKRYGEPHRIFPYCIFNSLEEDPVSWTFQCDEGRVYERCELFCTLSDVTFHRYFPFSLRLVSLKVGTDGTAKTGLINLVPEMQPGTTVPNVDYGIFRKQTSEHRIAKPDDAVMRMVVRDLSSVTEGNIAGIYTRCYATFFFEQKFSENLFKYIFISMLLLHTTYFLPLLEINDMVGTVITLVLTEVAFFFVLPETQEYTTTELVIIAHTLYMLGELFVLGFAQASGDAKLIEIIARGTGPANAVATIATFLFVTVEYRSYRAMLRNIKSKFEPVALGFVAYYDQVDQLI